MDGLTQREAAVVASLDEQALVEDLVQLVGLATQCAMLRPLERVAADGLSGAADQG